MNINDKPILFVLPEEIRHISTVNVVIGFLYFHNSNDGDIFRDAQK